MPFYIKIIIDATILICNYTHTRLKMIIFNLDKYLIMVNILTYSFNKLIIYYFVLNERDDKWKEMAKILQFIFLKIKMLVIVINKL